MIYDIIILGGGIAGLYTAYKLNKCSPHLKILLLEKENYLGGRVFTVHQGDMNVEAGAGRFADNHKYLMELLHLFSFKTPIFYVFYTLEHFIQDNFILFEKQHKVILNKMFKCVMTTLLFNFSEKEHCSYEIITPFYISNADFLYNYLVEII